MDCGRYTERTERALALAREAAEELKHRFIGSEHILLGLIRGEGAAADALARFGVTSDIVRPYADTLVGGGTHIFTDSSGFTPSAKRIMELALYEAKSLSENMIDTKHILLAIIRETDCFAYRILELAGADTASMKQYLYKKSETASDTAHLSNGNNPAFDGSGANAAQDGETPFTGEAVVRISPEAQRGTELPKYGTGREQRGTELPKYGTEGAQRGTELPKYGTEGAQAASERRERISDVQRTRIHSNATPVIDAYSQDLTALARMGEPDPLIGCENELDRLIRTLLRRGKNNPVLIGEPGVGKSAIVEGFAARAARGEVPEELKNARVVRLDLGAMIAGTRFRGEFEERLKAVLDEANENIILFIDEIHTLVGAGAGEGSFDAANIMKPALARRGLRVIGATTLDEYRRYIEKDAALERRFSPIIVSEPTRDEAIAILNGLKPRYEAHHEVQITDAAVTSCVEMSIRCIPDRFLPDKAIDLMDEAASKARLTAKTDKPVVDVNTVAAVVHDLTGIPIESLVSSDAERLAGLEKELGKRIFGRSEAINDAARTIRLAYAGISASKGALCTILIAGPSGSGKTEFANALSSALFPGEDALIRLDMAEYFDAASVNRLIGSPAGYRDSDEGGKLTEALRRKPYAVLLFDDIQYAHHDVLALIGRAVREGSIADARGKRASLGNAIVIMTVGIETVSERRAGFTSGAETGNARQGAGEWNADERQTPRAEAVRGRSGIEASLKRIIPAELVSSADCVLELDAPNAEICRAICKRQLDELRERLRRSGVKIRFDDTVAAAVCDAAALEAAAKHGANTIRRRLAALVEDRISEELLRGGINRVDEYICGFSENVLRFYTGSASGNAEP